MHSLRTPLKKHLEKHRAELDKLAKVVLEKELIQQEEIENILGKRKEKEDASLQIH